MFEQNQNLIDLKNDKKAYFEKHELIEYFQDILLSFNDKYESIKISKYETISSQDLYKVEVKPY
jgi:hypothetical protein